VGRATGRRPDAYGWAMRIVVTGGCGFIGSEVLAAAVGHEIVVLDAAAPADEPPGLADGPGGAWFLRGDVRDPAVVRSALAGADAVLHLAAKVGVEQGLADLPDYVSHNDLGTAVVLAEAAAAGVGRVVLASSMVVYGEGVADCPEHGQVRPGPRRASDLAAGRYEPPCPTCGAQLRPALVGEDVAPDPRSGYAASKVAQEHLAGVWARQCGGSVAALRFHNVYGPGLPLNTPYAGVAALFRTEVLAGRPPRVTEDGGQRRDFVHVRDVATSCLAALTAPLPTGALRAFNVGSGTPRTVLDLAVALAAAGGAPDPVVTGEARLADVRHITASSARARAELGWRPTEDFVTAVPGLLPSPLAGRVL
jgi:dTDP-L-rhamnose 4-epimerase